MDNTHKYRNIRTDLALEIHEIITKQYESENIDGVKMNIEFNQDETIKITWVEILNEEGSDQMNQPIGNYITVESQKMKENDIEAHEIIMQLLSDKLAKLYNFEKNPKILIVGLGNWNITPDALGPKVVEKILVTRHIKEVLPENIKNNVRIVSAISPGVMGITGIETAEMVKGVVEKVKPDVVIAIDALAARSTSRVNSTIQMNDTGISPGSGLGNKRKMLNKEYLGVDVIGIGVPTVVDAATLVNDTMDMILESMISQVPEGSHFYETLNNLDEDDKYEIIKNILDPYAGNMFVTPKEVDETVDRLANIIANSLNIGLHPGITKNDINKYMN